MTLVAVHNMGVFVLLAVGVAALLIQTARWYSRVRDARVMSRLLGDAIAEQLELPVKSVVVRCPPSWFHPTRQRFSVRVDGEHHQAAHDLLCDMCIAVVRRQGGQVIDERTPKSAS